MAETLDEVKKRVVSRFLGKSGVHAVGLRRSQNAVCVYVSPQAAPGPAVLEEIEREAAPFRLLVIPEERPAAT